MYNDKRKPNMEQKKKKKNTGFYIALAICIATVAGAAWTTYGNVTEGYQPEPRSSESSELPVGNDVSGESYSTSEENDQSSGESSSDESSSEVTESSSESGISAVPADAEQSSEPVQPVEGGKTIKKYSMDVPLFSKTTSDWRVHSGIDISANEGSPVRSMTDGVVKSLKKSPMLGNTICIEYGSCEITYCGLSEKPVVSEGNNVKAGDTIGYSAIVPGEQLDDSHIHIEVKQDGKTIDPETLTLNK